MDSTTINTTLEPERTLAVMQPYIFPYIGYFNLMAASNIFVIYDDVNFIKSGWINRNLLLSRQRVFGFSVPLEKQSPNKAINEISVTEFARFRAKFVKTLQLNYSKARNYSATMDYVDVTLSGKFRSIAELASRSLTLAAAIWGIDCQFLCSSQAFSDTKGLDKGDRLIAIAKRLKCTRYVNSIGGMAIYDKDLFARNGIGLQFVAPKLIPYAQVNSTEFQPALSIIDVMMNLRADEIGEYLNSYDLV